MHPAKLLLVGFVIVHAAPDGNRSCQSIEPLQITDTMGIRPGLSPAENRVEERTVDQRSDKKTLFGFQSFSKREQDVV